MERYSVTFDTAIFGTSVLVGSGVTATGFVDASGVAEVAGDGVFTPLFQISFLPLLMHVYFLL